MASRRQQQYKRQSSDTAQSFYFVFQLVDEFSEETVACNRNQNGQWVL